MFQSLNLSFTRGDDPQAVTENYRRVAEAMGGTLSDIVCSDQTHTTNVRRVDRSCGGYGVTKERSYTDVDGLVTDEPGLILATFTLTVYRFICRSHTPCDRTFPFRVERNGRTHGAAYHRGDAQGIS